MFGSQFATLGLLLLSSNHLSEAVRSHEEVLNSLRQALSESDAIGCLELLGDDYEFYSKLRVVTESNCTPERILFNQNVTEELGRAAQLYVTDSINRQRMICKLTFTNRLRRQAYRYGLNWRGKDTFEQFLRFVHPFPNLESNMRDFRESLSRNAESFVSWRLEQRNLRPRFNVRCMIYGWLAESSTILYDMFGGFLATLGQDPDFRPEIEPRYQDVLLAAKIASVTRNPRASLD